MTEEMNNFSPAPNKADVEAEKKSMRRCFSRCGWAVFVVAIATLAISIGLGIVIGVLMALGVDIMPLYNVLYNEYLLVFNEVLIAVALFAGAIVLIGMPKSVPERHSITVKEFCTMFCVCFAIGTVGNFIGNMWLEIWNTFTGNTVTNQLVDILMNISPWQMVLCTAILAPILEEFFFRKLLIDRMHKYGEAAAILVSAILFGLFHQNLSQFFYAFGIGLVLAYLYCRTGSFGLVTLLHMAFNFICGVLPSLVSVELLGFMEIMETVTETELMEMLPSLMGEYAVPLVLYMLYMVLSLVLNVLGIVLFIVNFKKIQVKKSESLLSTEEKIKAVTLNTGMAAAIAILVAMTLLSLF